MEVVSTNVSQPRAVSYRGEIHRTGIFKMPLPQGIYLGLEGVRNDAVIDRVNHGGSHKAVYGFAIDHYDQWRQTLGNSALGPGAFGENLTISGLMETDIHIGDQVELGEALLEVSQPRVPCFKLGIALDDARAPALFTRHFRTGVYFRVLREGTTKAGDPARVVFRHPAGISVHRLFRAKFDRQWPEAVAVMQAAADIEALAPEWRDKVAAFNGAG